MVIEDNIVKSKLSVRMIAQMKITEYVSKLMFVIVLKIIMEYLAILKIRIQKIY